MDSTVIDPFVPADQPDDIPTAGPDTDSQVSEDPFAIPVLTLPSGKQVEFRSLATVSQKNVKWLREALNTEGNGAFLNGVLGRGMQLLIIRWDLDMPIPRDDPRVIDRLSFPDANAIERHIQRRLVQMVNPAPRGE
jgi:hypothetical protein